MELELLADKRITIQALIDEDALLLDMKKRNFNGNDIATVRRKLVEGKYNALFVPEQFNGTEGTIILYVDGYEFNLKAQESMQ